MKKNLVKWLSLPITSSFVLYFLKDGKIVMDVPTKSIVDHFKNFD